MNAPPLQDELKRVRVAGTRPSGYSLALNALPFVYLLCGTGVILTVDGPAARVLIGLAWIYLLPPVVTRLALAVWGSPEGEGLGQDTRGYRLWWFVTQMQVVFNRLPVLEEALRLVPGCYPLWLQLWGARVSLKVYWASGAMIVDRTLLDVGAGVVVGTRAVISAHLAYKDEAGVFRVTVARTRIGDDVLIGAYAGIGPGCRIESGAEVPAAAFLRPYTHWTRGARVRTDRPRQR